MRLRTKFLVGGAGVLVVSCVVLLVADPKTTVRLTNDTHTMLYLSCGQTDVTATPGQRVSIPTSIFNPFPCLLSAPTGPAATNYGWYGCLNFNPVVDQVARMSRLITRESLARCWANAPR